MPSTQLLFQKGSSGGGRAIDRDPSERLCEFVEIRDRPLVDGLVALKHVEQLPMQRAAIAVSRPWPDRIVKIDWVMSGVHLPGGACARPRATAQTPTAQPQ